MLAKTRNLTQKENGKAKAQMKTKKNEGFESRVCSQRGPSSASTAAKSKRKAKPDSTTDQNTACVTQPAPHSFIQHRWFLCPCFQGMAKKKLIIIIIINLKKQPIRPVE